MAAVHDHRYPERALLAVRLGYVHPPHRQRPAGRDGVVHPAPPSPSWPGRPERRPGPPRPLRRPALRWVTCRTPASVFDHDRSISFCRFLTFGQVTVPRRLEDPLPQPRYVPLMDRPVHRVPRRPRPPVRSPSGAPTCPSVRSGCTGVSPQRLTWLASAPFRARHRTGIRPVIHGPAPEGGRPAALVSRCLSSAGIRFPAILSRQGFRPSYDRPTAPHRAPDHDGVSTFRTHEIRPDWAPSLSRDQRCSHEPGGVPGPPPAASQRHGSCTPAPPSPIRGRIFTGHQ